MEIQNTTDYERFSFHPQNRPLRSGHVGALAASIRKRNLLHCFPIVVTSDFTIMDGQHRYSAAKTLGVPLYYIISDDYQIQHVGDTNEAQANWNWKDRLHYYCVGGNINYVKLKAVMDSHPYLVSVGSTARLFTRESQLDFKRKFGSGLYVFNDELATPVLNAFEDFNQFPSAQRLLPNTHFQMAISQLVRSPKYDHVRMMNKLEYLSTRIHRCSVTKEYVEMLEYIYNFKTTESNRVKFTVRNERIES